jgi:protein O-GlcNAc transferase
MAELSIKQALDLALSHHRAGQLGQAEPIYRQILSAQPNNAPALGMLGTLCHQSGRTDEALDLLRRAVAANPNAAEGYANLGAVLLGAGKVDESIAASGRALQLSPNSTEAMSNLASALYVAKRFADAAAVYRRLISFQPKDAVATYHLGMSLRSIGQIDEAIAALASAIALRSDIPDWHFRLATALRDRGHLDDAVNALRTVIAMEPAHAEAHNFLGMIFSERASIDEAIVCYQKAIEVNPTFGGAYNNLGNALKEIGRVSEAILLYREADRLQPDSRIVGNMLYSMHFDANFNARQLLAEHVQWDNRFARPLRDAIVPHSNNRDSNRQLKIGYVGLDLREHPVGRFLLPLLANHDHSQFEIHCFTDLLRPDHLTQLMQQHADRWHPTSALSHEALAQLICKEQIDVLIDLSMHMDGTRLPTFARKPAPVQITYLAYCSTTGLAAMDYRVSDPYLDPPGGDEAVYSEKTLRLPRTYWCYQAPPYGAELTPLPAASKGYITFASLNTFSKVTPTTLDAWATIISNVPGSHLLIHTGEGAHRQQILGRFTSAGIDASRVEFVGRVPIDVYMQNYKSVDIALDPFPYVGGTTTCDALWMGVPVITLRGETAVARGGVSLLSNVGLPELIAGDVTDYIRIATSLAGNRSQLAQLRSTLRNQLIASPVMNAAQFARDFEALLRDAWKRWALQ